MTLIWHWPQIVMTCYYSWALVQCIAKAARGDMADRTIGVWVTLIVVGGQMALLYLGGFWAGATP